ncbi:MAG: outer membrane beta-barrel protein [Chlorobi bacterium]|nr:outer membrane beta-barrel protein [Chlorobiota bacterium]
MRITKAALFVFAITLFTTNIFAQGAYVNLNAGYGFSMSSQVMMFNTKYDYLIDNSTGEESFSGSIENVKGSLGEGFNFGGVFGYMFNKHIGYEIGVSYLLGNTIESARESTTKIIEADGSITTSTGITTNSLSSNMLRFTPSIVFTPGFEGIDPYVKFGMIIGIGSVKSEFAGDQFNSIQKSKFNGGAAIGLTGAIGANFPVNDKMVFFGEINMVNMSYAPTKGEITEAIVNGKDVLSDSDKEIEFVDKVYPSSEYTPDSGPNQELKTKYPFGSVGINIGLKLSI